MSTKTNTIKSVYLYLVSGMAIAVFMIAIIGLCNLALKEYVFDVKSWSEMEQLMPNSKIWECEDDQLFGTYDYKTGMYSQNDDEYSDEEKAKMREECEEKALAYRELQGKNDTNRELSIFISMLIGALPIYLFHWRIIRKENKK
jgi:hypothetical protein